MIHHDHILRMNMYGDIVKLRYHLGSLIYIVYLVMF